MASLIGVHLLPSTGEFSYDTIPYVGARPGVSIEVPINTYYAPGGSKTDYSYAMDQLQAEHPECTTISLVVAWFFDSETLPCNIYPSTTYAPIAAAPPTLGYLQAYFDRNNVDEPIPSSGSSPYNWLCSSLTQASTSLIPIPTDSSGNFVYGGTPSDDSIVRCIRDLKTRGFKVVFYPFLLGTASGKPWRGRITYSPDLSSAATAAVNAFFGSAATSQFTQNNTSLTVFYSGSSTDWTYRRMILHYANLCVIAGGVNLFVLGSELRGLETIRGPGWTKAGTTDGSGYAVWDYPFVAGLTTLAADVRSVFDAASLTKNMSTLTNLITYSADWSSWMGWQHPGENGQWPHLDSLYASSNIDFVSFDNYLPLSDWTTSESSQDIALWNASKPGSWPPSSPNAVGLGLTGSPTLYSKPYLKANIEGGEKFNWYYNNSTNGGASLDPNGSGQYVSLPEGDRATQTREAYYSGQQILANKQFRWWWNNLHYAVYDTGSGWVAQGARTEWAINSKPIIMLEYGVSSIDKATNQPNLFYSPASTESGTAFWSCWDSAPNQALTPRRDDTLSSLALQSIYEYWNTDSPSNNESVSGVVMVQFAFCCVWNWDARPFPTFPLLSGVWGDADEWQGGNWLGGKGPTLAPLAPSADPTPGSFATFPTIATLGWSVHVEPNFQTDISPRASGRELRNARRQDPLYDIELTYDALRSGNGYSELQSIAGFYLSEGGANALFWFTPTNAPAALGAPLLCRFAEDTADLENFMTLLWKFETVKLQTVRF